MYRSDFSRWRLYKLLEFYLKQHDLPFSVHRRPTGEYSGFYEVPFHFYFRVVETKDKGIDAAWRFDGFVSDHSEAAMGNWANYYLFQAARDKNYLTLHGIVIHKSLEYLPI
jgi:hypothetical protein